MKTAQTVDALAISANYKVDGIGFLHTSVAPDGYDEYKALPNACLWDGVLYGKAGWNSDTGVVIYRTDKKVAIPR